eukprot:12286142-Karenia_brevis.AAC.1
MRKNTRKGCNGYGACAVCRKTVCEEPPSYPGKVQVAAGGVQIADRQWKSNVSSIEFTAESRASGTLVEEA